MDPFKISFTTKAKETKIKQTNSLSLTVYFFWAAFFYVFRLIICNIILFLDQYQMPEFIYLYYIQIFLHTEK